MSIENRINRGDNPDDVKALFPGQEEFIDRLVAGLKKPVKKKASRKKAVKKTEA